MNEKQLRKSRKEAREAYDQLKEVKLKGFDIVYADEVMFTIKTLP